MAKVTITHAGINKVCKQSGESANKAMELVKIIN